MTSTAEQRIAVARARQLIETDVLLGVREVPTGFVGQPKVESDSVQHSPPVVAVAVGRTGRDDESDRQAQLDALRVRHEEECPHCTTVRGHSKHMVFGEGNPHADIFFVGEAPGETEDLVGRPFVGPAGQKLDEMIKAMGLRREDTYLANVLKSRPPGNRTPLPEEIAKCGPYLVEQILIVQPKVLVPLGGPATKLLLNVETGITKLRGTWAQWVPPADSGLAPIWTMPTFHPAYLLRNYTIETRREVWSDLTKVIQRISAS